MTAFRIAGFSGLVPRLARQLLAPNQAQVATNCILTSGDLRPRNAPLHVFTPAIQGEIRSMFRLEKDGNEKWLAWNREVDVARSPVAGNESQRFYYTGDGEPRVSDYDTATAGAGPHPSGCHVLGVTPPAAAPAVLPAGGSGATVSRSYVYTFVTAWGEESAPSPASAVTTGRIDDTWLLSGMDAAPPNGGMVSGAVRNAPAPGCVTVALDTVFGLRPGETVTFAAVAGMTDLNATFELARVDADTARVVVILSTGQAYESGGTWTRAAPHNTLGMNKRIYRTLTSASGTEYHYIATVTAATPTYADAASEADAALGEILPSGGWLMPPAGMRGIAIMANGIACGFVGNEICFSEPFRPYAWPLAYRQTYDEDIVAIGINGTTLVGMTKGNPFTITGVEPMTMGGGMEKLGVAWPCLAKRGVAGFAFGMGYPAPQGLVIAGGGFSDVVTKDLFTQREWLALNPGSFIAASADNRYYAGYAVDGSSLMLVIDKAETASFVKVNQRITAIWADPRTGELYVATDGRICRWEGDTGTKLAYEWKSRKFILAAPLNCGAAKIDADFEMTEEEQRNARHARQAIVASNQALIDACGLNDAMAEQPLAEHEVGGDGMQPLPPLSIDQLQFQLWADGRLRFSRQVADSRAFRLPSGYKADNLEIALSGNVKVTGVVLAETMDGLKQA